MKFGRRLSVKSSFFKKQTISKYYLLVAKQT